MKKFALLVLALVFTASTYASTLPVPTNEVLRTEITKMLKKADINFVSPFLTADVTFTITTKGEIVVLDVVSDHPELENFIKGKLNYKKVTIKAKRNGVVYKVPVKILNGK
jgi:hypothetical protein